jgi:hypothetical protein
MLVLFIFIFSSWSSANTEHSNGYWAGFFAASKLTENVNVHNEFQLRKNTDLGITSQSLFRAGPLWQWNDTTQFGLLYAHIRTGAITEHRFTQQVIYKTTETLSVRTRFEQRTIEKNNDLGLRLRLLGRYQKPINDTHSFVIWNEYFHQLTTPTWVYNEDFDRNRYFLGLRSKWNNISFEYGYSNQYVNRRGGDLSEHLFLFYLIM